MDSHGARIAGWCVGARRAARVTARATTAQKNATLHAWAKALRAAHGTILAANRDDVAAAQASGLAPAMVDRLSLNPARIEAMARACEEVARLEDPVGAIDAIRPRPSGIRVGRMRMPLGVILVIFEARPNVAVDSAALCLKAGNAVILRGGKEVLATNRVLVELLRENLRDLDFDAVQLVDDAERELLYALLKRQADIDLCVPRGGESLIRAVVAEARMPVVQHFQGICHVFLDARADAAMAERIVVNAKTQRPGVCNAMEGLLVHAAAAQRILPGLAHQLAGLQVEMVGCAEACALTPHITPATPSDFDTEFLALKLAVKVVADLDAALDFIAAHGSRHTATIVTADQHSAERFLREVDASCVLVNASTRFNDGGELGLGAEIGISTTKVHAYGPMGLDGLTCQKFVVYGNGEIRSAS